MRQEALCGLLAAVRNYRPDRGTSFKTFAALCIDRWLYTVIKNDTREKRYAGEAPLSFDMAVDDNEVLLHEAVEDRLTDVVMLVELRAAVAAVTNVVTNGLSPLERATVGGILNGESQLEVQARLGHPFLRWPDGRPRAKVVENAWQRAQNKIGRALAEADAIPLEQAA